MGLLGEVTGPLLERTGPPSWRRSQMVEAGPAAEVERNIKFGARFTG